MDETINCRQCGIEITTPPEVGRFGLLRFMCPKCVDAHEKERADELELHAKQMKEDGWNRICPPLYRDTDEARIDARIVKSVNEWKYGPKGIGLVGPAGIGKTRAVFILARRIYMDGKRVMPISATRFSKLSADQFVDGERQEARAALERTKETDLLIMDDIGKGKMTERTEMEFFDVLEHRTSHLLPTIWTANATGNELLNMMGKDRGEPILRRLAEFSEIVSAP